MEKKNYIRVQPEIDLAPIKQFIAEKVIPGAFEREEKAVFHHDLVKDMYKSGLLNVITPKEFGGLELPVADLIWMARSLGYGSAAVAATFIGSVLGYSLVVLYGTPDVRSSVCKRFQKEFSLWSMAMTEKNCGSDLERTETTAVKTKDGYIINGEKNFITNGSYATDISLFAQTVDENGKNIGISCFYIPGNSPGLTRGEGEKKMGWKDSNTGHLFFKDVKVPSTHLLGKEGDGLKILTHCLNRSKTLLGGVSVGICDRALEITIARLTDTVRFDKPLIEKHAIKHTLSRLSVKVECAWLLTCQAAAAWDNKSYAIKEASMAKLFGGRTASEVTGKCAELWGARGFLSEYEISRLYRDSKAIEIVEGPTLVQELLISKFALYPQKKESSLSNKYDPNKESDKKAA